MKRGLWGGDGLTDTSTTLAALEKRGPEFSF